MAAGVFVNLRIYTFHINATDTSWIEEGDRLKLTVIENREGLKGKNTTIVERDPHRDSYDKPNDNYSGARLGFSH